MTKRRTILFVVLLVVILILAIAICLAAMVTKDINDYYFPEGRQ